MADTFGLRKICIFRLWWQLGYPVIGIGGALWMLSTGLFELKAWGPLALGALAIWGVYDLVKAIKWGGFRVELTQEAITVGNATAQWADIVSAKVETAFGLNTAITLITKNGEELEIPCDTDSLAYITSQVEANVTDVTKST